MLGGIEMGGTVFHKNFKRKDRMISFVTPQDFKTGTLETLTSV